MRAPKGHTRPEACIREARAEVNKPGRKPSIFAPADASFRSCAPADAARQGGLFRIHGQTPGSRCGCLASHLGRTSKKPSRSLLQDKPLPAKRHPAFKRRPRHFMERWQSGRMHRTRNAAYGQPYRGFESLPLRHKIFNFNYLLTSLRRHQLVRLLDACVGMIEGHACGTFLSPRAVSALPTSPSNGRYP